MIKKLNPLAGTGNPIYIDDLTGLNTLMIMLKSAMQTSGRQTLILSGFDKRPDGSYDGGVVWHKGELYEMISNTPPDWWLYAETRLIDQRIAEDNTEYFAYTEYYVNMYPSGTGLPSVIGQATDANILAWRKPPILDGTISGSQLKRRTITNDQLGIGCVDIPQILPNIITDMEIKPKSLTNASIANNTILPSILDKSIVSSRYQSINAMITLTLIGNNITSNVVWKSTISNDYYIDASYFKNPTGSGAFMVFSVKFKSVLWQSGSVRINLSDDTNLANVTTISAGKTAQCAVVTDTSFPTNTPIYVNISFLSTAFDDSEVTF